MNGASGDPPPELPDAVAPPGTEPGAAISADTSGGLADRTASDMWRPGRGASRATAGIVPTPDEATIATPDGATIDALVARAVHGDPAAFGALYDEFAPRVYRYAAFRVREPSDAEDLMQRVFVKVIEALPRYEQRGVPFSAWLFRLAHNAVIDFARTARDHAPLDVAADHADGAPDPSETAARAADSVHLDRALRTLTPDQQQVIACRFYAGLSVSETARVLGRREIAVRSLQFRALASLRRALGVAERAGAEGLQVEEIAR